MSSLRPLYKIQILQCSSNLNSRHKLDSNGGADHFFMKSLNLYSDFVDSISVYLMFSGNEFHMCSASD